MVCVFNLMSSSQAGRRRFDPGLPLQPLIVFVDVDAVAGKLSACVGIAFNLLNPAPRTTQHLEIHVDQAQGLKSRLGSVGGRRPLVRYSFVGSSVTQYGCKGGALVTYTLSRNSAWNWPRR